MNEEGSFTVREATAADAEAVAVLNGVVQGLHHEAHPERYRPPEARLVIPMFRDWLSGIDERSWGPGRTVTRGWICEGPGDEPLGYVIAVHRETPESPFKPAANWVQLDQIAVSPGARRRGVGEALTSEVVRWAEALGARTLELSVGDFNQGAQEFFKSMGFAPLHHQMSRKLQSRRRGANSGHER